MMHALAFILCLAGFAALAFAAERQQDNIFDRTLLPRVTYGLRAAAAILLLLALALLLMRQGWAMGLVLFSGHTSAAAGVVYCTLIAYARRRNQTG